MDNSEYTDGQSDEDEHSENNQNQSESTLSAEQIRDVLRNDKISKIIGGYAILIVTIAIIGGLNQVIGAISITTAGMIIYVTQHPNSEYTYETLREQIIGLAVGISFLAIGIMYILTGIVWDTFPLI